jgi:Exportin-T/Exportin 1-like protein
MDDFERAVLVCLNPSAETAVQSQALEYCRQIRDSPDGPAFALARLTPPARPEAAFWCLQLLHQSVVIAPSIPRASSVSPVRQPVLDYATALVTTHATSNPQPPYIRNKLAQLIASLIAAEYPATWPGAMSEFVLPLASAADKRTPASLDLFFRIMRALDEDVTSIHAAQVSETTRVVSVRVKDAIRDDCIPQLISLLATLVAVPAYVDHAYDLIARNVEWLDISLFANDNFMPAIYSSLTCAAPSPTRAAAAYAFRAILSKRMSQENKLALLTHLQVLSLLRAIPHVVPDDDDASSNSPGLDKLSAADLNIQSGRRETAALVNCIASIALDMLRTYAPAGKNKISVVNPSAREVMLQVAGSIAEAALPLALRFVSADVDDSMSAEALQCVTGYINTFSRLNASERPISSEGANGAQIHSSVSQGEDTPDLSVWTHGHQGLVATLSVIEEKACFPPDYNPADEADDEHPFSLLRHVLVKSVLRGIARAVPSMVLEFVRRIASHPATATSVPRTELVLTMLALLSETAPDVAGVSETLISAISNPPRFPQSPDLSGPAAGQVDAVTIAHFNLVARCSRLVLLAQNEALLVTILEPFVDNRGLRHPTSASVRSHSAYLLLKVARPLRASIASRHLDAVMGAIQPLLFPVQPTNAGQVFTDQMNLFEAAGYLVGTDPNRPDSINYLGTLLRAMIDALRPGVSVEHQCGVVTAAGQLSKGFGGDSKLLILAGSSDISNPGSPGGKAPGGISSTGDGNVSGGGGSSLDIKTQKSKPLSEQALAMWTACLEAILSNVGLMSAEAAGTSMHGELREKVMFFLHRMVDTMGAAVVVYLKAVMKVLLRNASTASDVRGVTVLASQAVGKFAVEFEPVMTEIFADIVQRVFHFPAVVDPSTMLAMSEVAREAVELRKGYCYMVHAILAADIAKVLTADVNAPLLHGVTSALAESIIGEGLDLRAAATVMKMSMSIMTKLTNCWITPFGDDVVTGFGDGPGGRQRGFSQFLVDVMAPACVKSGIVSSLFAGGNYKTGAGMAVVTENVGMQRTIAMRLGPRFGEAVASRGFAGLNSPDVATFVNALYQPAVSLTQLSSMYVSLVQRMR